MQQKHWCRLKQVPCSVLLVLVLAVASTIAGCAGAAPLAAPVEYRHFFDTGPLSVHVVSFDLDATSLSLKATVGQGVNGSETISDMMKEIAPENGVPLAAVNGDYFEFLTEPRYRGTVQGITIVDGELLSGPGGTTFWIDEDRQAHFARVRSGFSITWPDGTTIPFGLNCSPSDYKSEVHSADVVLFTPAFGTSTATANVRELVLEPVAGAAWLPLRPNAKLQARVRAVTTAGNTAIRAGEMVVSIAAKADKAVPVVKTGEIIEISAALTPDLSRAATAVAGDPLLLQDGQPVPNLNNTNRHPRTAVGFAGRRCFLVVVDGRKPQLSTGATHAELAAIMQRLGCTDALNLDGGGSSTFWWNGRVVNSPSDGTQRAVGNALVLLSRPQQSPAPGPTEATH